MDISQIRGHVEQAETLIRDLGDGGSLADATKSARMAAWKQAVHALVAAKAETDHASLRHPDQLFVRAAIVEVIERLTRELHGVDL